MNTYAEALRRNCGFQRLKARGATDYPYGEHLQDCDICQGAEEIEELHAALQPFAQFNDALKEWRFGPSGYVLQEKRPEHIPFLRWLEPTPPPWVRGKHSKTVRKLEVWPSDFERAETAHKAGLK